MTSSCLYQNRFLIVISYQFQRAVLCPHHPSCFNCQNHPLECQNHPTVVHSDDNHPIVLNHITYRPTLESHFNI
jgi:hypothetical protein